MANEKISQLTNGNPAQSGDLLPIARSGANYSVTAGSIAALAGGGGFSPSKANLAPGAIPFLPNQGGADASRSYALRIRGSSFAQPYSGSAQVSLGSGGTALDVNSIVIRSTVAGGNTFVATQAITFGSSHSFTVPANLPIYWSDPFTFTFDSDHDYYVVVYVGSVNTGLAYASLPNVSQSPVSVSTSNPGDHTADTTVSGAAWNWDTTTFWRIFSGLRTA